jgi:hypothetical protein
MVLSGMNSCGVHKFGIAREVNPKEDVHVFLHKKIIITGFKREGSIKLVNLPNNENKNFDFFIPVGEQEFYLKTAYTHRIYSFISQSTSIKVNAEKGDIVFICAEIKEIGSRQPSGGNVDVLLLPTILYLKTDEEKNKAVPKEQLDTAYFEDRCKAAVYGKP